MSGISAVSRSLLCSTKQSLTGQQGFYISAVPCKEITAGLIEQRSNYSSLPLPKNVKEIKASEKAQFSPRRSRDMTSARMANGSANQHGAMFSSSFMSNQGSQQTNACSHPADNHMQVYDASNTVSLSSVMQTTVPYPFKTDDNNATPLNMPGGQWAQDDKYLSGDLHEFHSTQLKKLNKGIAQSMLRDIKHSCGVNSLPYPLLNNYNNNNNNFSLRTLCRSYVTSRPNPQIYCCVRNRNVACFNALEGNGNNSMLKHYVHTCPPLSSSHDSVQLSQKEKLKRAVKEYGATVIIFHVAISLTSLGFFYLLVSSGVDMTAIIKYLNINIGVEKSTSSTITNDNSSVDNNSLELDNSAIIESTSVVAGVSTFVLAYAVHKVFAPVRIAITLSCTPFIVRHLRKIGFLKPPKLK